MKIMEESSRGRIDHGDCTDDEADKNKHGDDVEYDEDTVTMSKISVATRATPLPYMGRRLRSVLSPSRHEATWHCRGGRGLQ